MKLGPRLLVASVLTALSTAVCPAQDAVDFSREVRPILSDNCFKCHGPDDDARQADLRLDTQEGLFADRDGAKVVAAENPGASELFLRISSNDPDVRMPPPDSGKSLTEEEIELLRRWIEQGAGWEEHWAFVPPVRPPVPDVADREWTVNPIDYFVLHVLEQRDLTPSSQASPETLIRRVTLDLTGLPPTPAEVDAYLADRSPDRYERLVDRLLASPRYGEHMATGWLDAARYADTSGYQNDGPREMWRWRDWVIDAYNAGMSFDQFTIEQLAGDLLPDPTLEQRIATGFNRNHRGNAEGGIIPEEYAVEYVVDRVDTTGAVWLGMTIGCGRCHEHKFDPVSQQEYYGLFAYFNNVPEHGRAIKEGNSPPFIKAPTLAQRAQLAELDQRIDAAQQTWDDLAAETAAAQQEWERTLNTGDAIDWSPGEGLAAHFALDGSTADIVEPQRRAGPVGRSVEFVDAPAGRGIRLDDETFLDAGDVGNFGYFDAFSVSLWLRPDGRLTGGVVSRMSDDSDSDGWAVHLKDGHVQVNLVKRWLDDSLRVETETQLAAGEWRHITVVYDGSRVAKGVSVYFDGEPQPLRVNLDAINQSFANDQPLRIGSTGTRERLGGSFDDLRIYDRALSAREAAILSVPQSVDALAALPEGQRSSQQAAKIQDYFLHYAAPAHIRTAHQRLTGLKAERKQLMDSFPTVMVMEEIDPPRTTHVLLRGAYDRPGEPVEPGVPAAVSGGEQIGGNRLDLARWLVDGDNPLTARVAVNRYWQRIFGVGLVKTSEDFGTQGEPPSHPELLDWLAMEFVRTGWDVKGMQRLIVTSATYRQSSHVAPDLKALDPENRLLARGPRFRLTAEMVRDQALAVAGLLTEEIGGPSIKPYQPAGLWEEIATVTQYDQSTGADLYRRSVYCYTKRTVANPTLALFDADTREACVLKRGRTNTPLQALTLLNDVTFVEAARVLATQVLREGHSNEEQQIDELFRRAVGRPAEDAERELLAGSLAAHRTHYRDHPESATELISTGEYPVDTRLDPADLAALTAIAGVVMNLDEVLTKE